MQPRISALPNQGLAATLAERLSRIDLASARFLAAMLIAPLAAVVLNLIRLDSDSLVSGSPWSLTLVALTAAASYAGLYCFGLPGLRLLYRLRRLNLLTAAATGALSGTGLVGGVAGLMSLAMGIDIAEPATLLAWSALLGLSVNLAFVLIAGIPPQATQPQADTEFANR